MLVRPIKEKVYLKRLDKSLALNFITLEDEEWMQNNISSESLREIKVDTILMIFWRLLDDESKRAVRDARIIKWEGLKETVLETENPAEKLKFLLSGADEASGVWDAIQKTRLKSSPKKEENEKKSLKEEQSSLTIKSPNLSPENMAIL